MGRRLAAPALAASGRLEREALEVEQAWRIARLVLDAGQGRVVALAQPPTDDPAEAGFLEQPPQGRLVVDEAMAPGAEEGVGHRRFGRRMAGRQEVALEEGVVVA